MNLNGYTNQLIQWEYQSSFIYDNPFNDIDLDVIITTPDNQQFTLPTFWRGEQRWAVRFIPKIIGNYTIHTRCSDTNNFSLHHCKGILNVQLSETKPHISLQVTDNKKYLTRENNKPFFWLSDTWWMALSHRLSYPKDFKYLTSYRKKQGFNTILLVAGLFPDMHSFDPRCKNEAGFPWEENYTHINPDYFDEADKRIAHLVESEFIPTILGAWGYYLQELGIKKMKQHWRYIIARWGVYPVVWCIAGEATMPYYLSKHRNKDSKLLKSGWSEIGRYIKALDPFHRLLTIHPTEIGTEQIEDKNILDINLLQAGHNGYDSVSNSIKLLQQEYPYQNIPLIMSEVNYEGILRDTHADVQRLTFWSAFLSGSKGFGYGANGIWQINTKESPFGATPHGGTWGNIPWQEALQHKGAKQLGLAKKLLERYEWWLIEPQQHTLIPHNDTLNPKIPRIAGIGTRLRIVYFYTPITPWDEPRFHIAHLDSNSHYTAFFWDPQTAKESPIGTIIPNNEGIWEIPPLPTFEDWILIIKSHTSSTKIPKRKFSLSSKIFHIQRRVKKFLKQWIT